MRMCMSYAPRLKTFLGVPSPILLKQSSHCRIAWFFFIALGIKQVNATHTLLIELQASSEESWVEMKRLAWSNKLLHLEVCFDVCSHATKNCHLEWHKTISSPYYEYKLCTGSLQCFMENTGFVYRCNFALPSTTSSLRYTKTMSRTNTKNVQVPHMAFVVCFLALQCGCVWVTLGASRASSACRAPSFSGTAVIAASYIYF